VTPIIYKITDTGSIVLKSEYKALEELYQKSEQKFEVEKKKRIELQNENEEISSKLVAALKTESSDDGVRDPLRVDLDLEENYQALLDRYPEDEIKDIFRTIDTESSISISDSIIDFLLSINAIEIYQRSLDRRKASFSLTSKGKELRRKFTLKKHN
jgi:DNA-binding PadR family transcriptional regulator